MHGVLHGNIYAVHTSVAQYRPASPKLQRKDKDHNSFGRVGDHVDFGRKTNEDLSVVFLSPVFVCFAP